MAERKAIELTEAEWKAAERDILLMEAISSDQHRLKGVVPCDNAIDHVREQGIR
jgi:hypothetical protein